MRLHPEPGVQAGLRRLGQELFAVGAQALKITLTLVFAYGLASGSSYAARVTERSKQKGIAEGARIDLQQKITALKREISRTEAARESAADTLAESEAAISETNRSLYDLAEEQKEVEARLAQLSKEQAKLAGLVDKQQQRLARLMREQYIAGNEDRFKLLLSGDNPNRINRDLQYMGYVSQAQARLIGLLRTNLEAVDANKNSAKAAQEELGEIAQEEREQRSVLEIEKSKRASLLSKLASKLSSQRKEAGNLERDEQRMAGLVEKLTRLMEEQKKVETVAQERKRLELLAKARAEREAEAANQAKKDKQRSIAAKTDPKSGADSHSADEKSRDKPIVRNPADATLNTTAVRQGDSPETKTNDASSVTTVRDGVFARLRGQLKLPVHGAVSARYGSRRGDGPSLKGLFIRVDEGAEVKAVATGRVVFAEWLRGFGNVIIVDHGSQYLSIYGNNQSVLKHAGDVVRGGDTIASAGNSGGNEQSGLYFEMRHQGRPFDPLAWVSVK